MIHRAAVLAAFAAFAAFLTAVPARAADAGFKTEDEKVLYALGAALGQSVTRTTSVFALTPEEKKLVSQGIKDSFEGKKLKLDMTVYGPKIDKFAQERQAKAAEKNKKDEKEFLEKASKAEGAVVTPSGLIYTELKAGTGAAPASTDTVKVHYHGTLVNGQVFDSSVQRGSPATFPLNGVIPCWTEGLQKMKVGGKAKLVCPSSIAYGDRGMPPAIPGGSTLIFEVQLLDIVKP